jgi:hypothetical protein
MEQRSTPKGAPAPQPISSAKIPHFSSQIHHSSTSRSSHPPISSYLSQSLLPCEARKLIEGEVKAARASEVAPQGCSLDMMESFPIWSKSSAAVPGQIGIPLTVWLGSSRLMKPLVMRRILLRPLFLAASARRRRRGGVQRYASPPPLSPSCPALSSPRISWVVNAVGFGPLSRAFPLNPSQLLSNQRWPANRLKSSLT